MVAVPQQPQQQSLSATTGSAHISVSGIFTQHFVESLMQPVVSHAAVQAEAFALPWERMQSLREREEHMALMFELICEQWDRVREQPEKMTPTQVRERWLRPFFEALEFRWVYLRGDTVLENDDDLRFDLSHRGWSEKDTPQRAPVIHTVAPTQGLDERVSGRRGVKGKSPHDMVQAFLNASPDDRWAIVTNGRVLRLLHKYYQVYSRGYV